MQKRQSTDYFERRAEEEAAAAERAADERAAQSHRELADQYRKRAAVIETPSAEAPANGPGILSKEFRIVP